MCVYIFSISVVVKPYDDKLQFMIAAFFSTTNFSFHENQTITVMLESRHAVFDFEVVSLSVLSAALCVVQKRSLSWAALLHPRNIHLLPPP